MSSKGPGIESLPESLRPKAASDWSLVHNALGDGILSKIPERVLQSFPIILSSSPFIVEQIQRRPELLHYLIEGQWLERPRSLAEIANAFQTALENTGDEAAFHRALRRARNLEMVRIAWRDIAGWAPIDETLKDLSHLAEVAIEAALQILFARATERYGTPKNRAGDPQNLIVLGMGKLGGGELNFSSDIDLIFAYRDDGVLEDRKDTSYAEFYTRLGRDLIRALDFPTEDGFVFRVDTRLRPFGESGPLVLHFEALERYYESQAREWERYAMIKARALAGDPLGGKELERFLHPFIYRRYLDYRAFGELRELKRMIQRELSRKGDRLNVKLGEGGIREIEFIGQAFQLIRGGFEKSLQSRSIIEVLKSLETLGLLPAPIVQRLLEGYRFLRRVENRLQEYRDRQTHTLPVLEPEKTALAHALGFSDFDAFSVELAHVQKDIHTLFEEVIRLDQDPEAVSFPIDAEPSEMEDFLSGMNFENAADLTVLLLNFRQSAPIRKLSSKGRTELTRLLPSLIRELTGSKDPETVLGRILELLKAIASRNVYLTLLAENPDARGRLVRLVTASPWFAHTLSEFPILLDELIDHRNLESPLEPMKLEAELSAKIEAKDPEDLEAFMMTLRHFQQTTRLKIAQADIVGHLPLPEVSNHLTQLAEVLLKAALTKAFKITRDRHGVPPRNSRDTPSGFAIIAYGKLGGLELGYASDLDLVFLYEGEAELETDGEKPLSTAEFYARIAQRTLHIIGTQTPAGILYETDLRLRPSGNSGLLVTRIKAFESYQMESAWTWEQQALVKARFVAGDPKVGEAFSSIRAKALGRPRALEPLALEVLEMRSKMRSARSGQSGDTFDLKQDPGGIVDIEFLVQFWVLAEAGSDPKLTQWTDVLRLLDELSETGRISREEGDFLKASYFTLREEAHRAQLDERKATADAAGFEDLRRGVSAIWQRHLGRFETPSLAPPLHPA